MNVCGKSYFPSIPRADFGHTALIRVLIRTLAARADRRGLCGIGHEAVALGVGDHDGGKPDEATIARHNILWPIGTWRRHIPAPRVRFVDGRWVTHLRLFVTRENVAVEAILRHVAGVGAKPQFHVSLVVRRDDHLHVHRATRFVSARNVVSDACEINASVPAADVMIAIAAVPVHALAIEEIAFVEVAA